MLFSVPQYILESTLCFGVLLLYIQLALPQQASTRIQWFIWTSMLAAMVIPALEVPILLQQHGTESIIPVIAKAEQWQNGWQKALGQITPGLSISLADTLLFIYFLGFAYRAYQWIDSNHFFRINTKNQRSDLAHASADAPQRSVTIWADILWESWRQKRQFPKAVLPFLPYLHTQHYLRVWTLDWMRMFHWFQPMAGRLHTQYHRLATQIETPNSSKIPGAEHRFLFVGYSLYLPLIVLFSLNFSSQIPGTEYLRVFNHQFTEMAHQPFIQVADLPKESNAYLKWGIQRLALSAYEEGEPLQTEFLHLTPELIYLLPAVEFQVFNDGEFLAYRNWEASVMVPGTNQARIFKRPSSFWAFLRGLPERAELSIYLKIEDQSGKLWVASATISPDGQVYNPEQGIRALVPELSTIRWSVPRVLEPLESSEADYVLLWGDISIPLNKYANPDVYTGFVQLDREEFMAQIGNQIQVLHGSEALDFKEFSIRFSEPGTWNWYSTDHLYPEIRQKTQANIDSEQMAQIDREVQNGDWLVLQGKVG
ncbi:MAG: hypothetical protein AAFU60_08450, partial [Bacteroidota bacterium]